LEQLHRRGMPQHMRRHALSLQRRAAPLGAASVADDQSLDGIAAEWPAATAREGRRHRLGRALPQPFRQDRDHILTERRAAFLPALAVAADVRARAKDDIVAPQADEFGYPQPRLDRYQQQGSVLAADPGHPVRCRQQRVDLLRREVFDQPPFVPLAGDGQDAAALLGIGRFLKRDVVEEGMDGCQPRVPAPGAVPAPRLEVIEKIADEAGV
jgi:hypothetical protein